MSTTLTQPLPPDLLLIVFIHGFKGTGETFQQFPQRLQHVLQESVHNISVECVVFPAYETKGELDQAVERFVDWLTNLVVKREVANGTGGGAGKAKIVLCGHSMGGLLAADTLLAISKSRPDTKAPLWPRVIACIAYDTPYYGLHPYVFKNTATKAAEYADTAKTVATTVFSSLAGMGFGTAAQKATSTRRPVAAITAPPAAAASGWGKWAPIVGGALAAGAAAGAAYYNREDLGLGYAWASDHMKYVGVLWDEGKLKTRVEEVMDLEKMEGVMFRTFYTIIPASPPSHLLPRTFIVLPPTSSRSYPFFLPARNTLAPDELQSHTGMFAASTNDGYYQLGLETVKIIREALGRTRVVVEASRQQVNVPREAVALEGGSGNSKVKDNAQMEEVGNPWADGNQGRNQQDAKYLMSNVNPWAPVGEAGKSQNDRNGNLIDL